MLFWSTFLFIIAIVIIIVDIFIEVFGFIGAVGVLVLLTSLILTYSQVPNGELIVIGKLLLLIPTALTTVYAFKKLGIKDKVFLTETLAEEHHEFEDLEIFVGMVGKTITALKPFGHTILNGKSYEVRSISAYIKEGRDVQVSYVKENMLFVKEIEKLEGDE